MDDRRVYIERPAGIKCTNPHCPYNDNAYEQDMRRWRCIDDGYCLNCGDDQLKADQEMWYIYGE